MSVPPLIKNAAFVPLSSWALRAHEDKEEEEHEDDEYEESPLSAPSSPSSPRSGDDGDEAPMELENTPPMIHYCMDNMDYETYIPCKTKSEALMNLNRCKQYLTENVRFMDQSEIQDTLLSIADAEDELSLFTK